jgi:hypothetical protein
MSISSACSVRIGSARNSAHRLIGTCARCASNHARIRVNERRAKLSKAVPGISLLSAIAIENNLTTREETGNQPWGCSSVKAAPPSRGSTWPMPADGVFSWAARLHVTAMVITMGLRLELPRGLFTRDVRGAISFESSLDGERSEPIMRRLGSTLTHHK